MNRFLVLLAFAAVSHAATIPTKIMEHENGELWRAWKEKHDKAYETQAEELKRFNNWSENLEKVAKHNVEHEFGLHTYTKAMNMFADLTQEEFIARHTRCTTPDFPEVSRDSVYKDINTSDLPKEVDWSYTGYVTRVKDQGACGSCWIFSAIGALEGQYFKATNYSSSLSEQQIVDCYGRGCNGGWPVEVYNYLMNAVGSIEDVYYPYHLNSPIGVAGTQCMESSYPPEAKVLAWETLTSGDEEALQEATATVGPISVCLNATAFHSYGGGVLNDPDCGSSGETGVAGHCVLVVGYGTDASGGDYWLVKNSWGTGWGVGGYIKMARNQDNMCSIASYATYPVV